MNFSVENLHLLVQSPLCPSNLVADLIRKPFRLCHHLHMCYGPLASSKGIDDRIVGPLQELILPLPGIGCNRGGGGDESDEAGIVQPRATRSVTP